MAWASVSSWVHKQPFLGLFQLSNGGLHVGAVAHGVLYVVDAVRFLAAGTRGCLEVVGCFVREVAEEADGVASELAGVGAVASL